MKWAGMENLDGNPENLTIPSKRSNRVEKKKFVKEVVGSFVERYVLSEFDVEKALREKIENMKDKERQLRNEATSAGEMIFNTGTRLYDNS